jgi:serine/threonine protein kinase
LLAAAKKTVFPASGKGFGPHRFLHKNHRRKIRCGNLAALDKSPRGDAAKQPCIAPKIGNSESNERRVRNGPMLKVKDTLRATVHLGFDGRVFKAYHGPDAAKRFANEVRILRHLAAHGCDFVPRLLEADEKNLRIVTSNCGTRVERIDDARAQRLFAELENFGVRHDDADPRNITYRFSDGRFCLIDFEFATILPESKTEPK